MLSEKHSDHGWKARLEEPGEWPESSLLNREASWKQLRPRLHPSSSNRLFNRWWVAAGGLLVLLAIGFHFYRQPVDMVQAVTPAMFPPFIPSQPVDKKVILPSTGNVFPQPVKPSTGVQAARRIPPARPLVISPVEPDKKNAATVTSISLAASPPISSSIAKQPIPVAVITVPAKRKLRVVHINELGDGTQHLYPTASNENYPAKRFPLFQGEVYRQAAPPLPSSGINVFKSTPHTPN